MPGIDAGKTGSGTVVVNNALIALLVALLAAPAFLLLATALRVDSLSWAVRAILWVVAGVAVFLVADASGGIAPAIAKIGLREITVQTMVHGAYAVLGLAISGAVIVAAQYVAKVPIGDREAFERIAALPFMQRLFIVVTAAVTEEVLYRGVAISVGTAMFGAQLPAAAVATAGFTLAHFRWRSTHLVQVLFAGAVLSACFVLTGDLWACILAHLVADIGFVLAPALRPRTTGEPRSLS